MRRVFRIPFVRQRLGRDLDDELSFHLETRIARLVAAGLTADDARAEALRQFGDLDAVRRDCLTLDRQREHSMHRANLFDELRQNVVFGLRTLRRNPAFTALVVGALAIGIGANTAIFTLIDAVALRGLPVKDPGALVAIGNPARVGGNSHGSPRTNMLSYRLYRDLRAQNRSFTDVAATGKTDRLDVRVDQRSTDLEHPRGRFVSANYFALLGVRPQLGQPFDPGIDDVAGSGPEVVISDSYWTRRFDRSASVIGRRVTVDDVPMTIVGVAPPGFLGEVVGQSNDIWIPMSMHDVLKPHARALDDRSESWILAIGRLEPGVTMTQATADVSSVLRRSIVTNAGSTEAAQSFIAGKPTYYVSDGSRGLSAVRATFTTPLYTLLAGVALLLCIICANVANLLLARALARGREMAVRLALGAHRSRLVRQLLMESALIAAMSTVAGLFIAFWGSRALIAMASDGGSIMLPTALDGRVLGFTLAVTVAAVGLFGAVPALRASRVDLASSMRGGAGSISGGLGRRGGRAPLGRLLIIGQVALSVVLLVGAAMLVRSLRSVEGVDVGVDRDHLLVADLDVQTRGYQGARLVNRSHALRDRVSAIPGVTAVTFSENGLFSGNDSDASFQLPGFPWRAPTDSVIAFDQVGPSYFDAVGARLIAGRSFVSSDESSLPRQGILNASAAAFLFPGRSAIGRHIYFSDTIAVEIIGVAADVRATRLEGEPDRRIYFSYNHAADRSDGLDAPGALILEIRTSGDPNAVVAQVRRAIAAVDPSLPIDALQPLSDLMRQSIREQRMVAKLATLFGALALFLAAIGLYGVMTYAVTRRTGEIGLRVALGAQAADVARMVLTEGMVMVGIGLLIGVPLALAAVRLLQAKSGALPVDVAAVVVAILILAASAAVAVLIPARRASSVAPGIALKAE